MATVVGFLFLAHPGLSVGGGSVVRTVDVVCVTFLVTWWLAYGRTRHHDAMVRGVLVAGLSVALLWATGALSNEPILSLRLVEFGLFFAIAFSVAHRSPQVIVWVTAGMLLSFGLIVILTYVQVALWPVLGWEGSLEFDRMISAFSAKESPAFIYQAGPIIRPTATYNHPNAFAGVLGLGVAGILGGAWSLPAGRARRVLLGLAVAGLAAIVLTSSRGAFAAVVVVATFSRMLTRRASRGRLVVGVAFLGFTVLAGGLSLIPESQESYAGRIASLVSMGDDASLEGREETISTALVLLAEDPVGGHGREAVLAELPAVHNSVLFLAVVVGVLPALALATAVLYGVALGARVLSNNLPPVVTAASWIVLTGAVLLITEDRPDDPAFMPIFVGAIAVIAAHEASLRSSRGRAAFARKH